MPTFLHKMRNNKEARILSKLYYTRHNLKAQQGQRGRERLSSVHFPPHPLFCHVFLSSLHALSVVVPVRPSQSPSVATIVQ